MQQNNELTVQQLFNLLILYIETIFKHFLVSFNVYEQFYKHSILINLSKNFFVTLIIKAII